MAWEEGPEVDQRIGEGRAGDVEDLGGVQGEGPEG